MGDLEWVIKMIDRRIMKISKLKINLVTVLVNCIILVLVAICQFMWKYVNRNSKNMTYRQKVLKAIYPAWMW